MSALAVTPAYLQLLAKIPPRVIRSEEQNDSYIEALYDLEQNQLSWTTDERELSDLLTLLIEEFEQRHYALTRSTPAEALEFLMDQHSLKPADLYDIFGTPDVATEILAGRHLLEPDQIRRLAQRFQVSADPFF
jgi:HTH-type transcriptional regulator/antitoxin HigA